jgi:hypothetical protein
MQSVATDVNEAPGRARDLETFHREIRRSGGFFHREFRRSRGDDSPDLLNSL